ncbi:MAG: UrcA family protein [Croceibacterium sp.]
MRNITLSALAAFSLASLTTPAAAEPVSIVVPYGDLNLANAAGMATLNGRIEAAAGRICGKPEVRNLLDGADHQKCMRETHSSVTIEIARVTGNPRVLALNTVSARR